MMTNASQLQQLLGQSQKNNLQNFEDSMSLKKDRSTKDESHATVTTSWHKHVIEEYKSGNRLSCFHEMSLLIPHLGRFPASLQKFQYFFAFWWRSTILRSQVEVRQSWERFVVLRKFFDGWKMFASITSVQASENVLISQAKCFSRQFCTWQSER